MKSKILNLLITIITIALSGCFFNNEKDYSNIEVTRSGNISELSYDELTGKIIGNQTFVLIYGSNTCSGCTSQKNVAKEFVENEYQKVFYIDSNKLSSSQKDQLGNYKVKTFQSPITHIFVTASTSKNPDAQSKLAKYSTDIMNLEKFTKFIRNYIAPSPVLLSLDEIKAKKNNNEKFLLIIARASCSTCKLFYQNYFNSWYIKNQETSNIYMFDAAEVRVNTPINPDTNLPYATIEDVELNKLTLASTGLATQEELDELKAKIQEYIDARAELKFQWTPVVHLFEDGSIKDSFQYLDNNYYQTDLTISYENFNYTYLEDAKETLNNKTYKSDDLKKVAMENCYNKLARLWFTDNNVKK